MDQKEQHLLQLTYAKQNSELQEIKKRFSEFSKYFFNVRRNITIVYDRTIIYIIHKEYLKLIDLGKAYVITDLAYNYQRNILVFLTQENYLYAHFAASKTQLQIKKDFKRIFLIDWIYSAQQTANFFIAEEGGVHIYRLDQEKKQLKEVKHLSGKYHCFLYEPVMQFLVGFTFGDCDTANVFHFESQKAKNWFRNGQIQVNFTEDEVISERIRRTKSFCLKGTRHNKQIFAKDSSNDEYFIDIFRINGTPYMSFYFPNEGKLQLTPMLQFSEKKQVTIKLPSDSLPSFNVVDNMLVVHLKNQKITFIYDVNPTGFQTLVSPYPLIHDDKQITQKIYSGQFIGKRLLLPNGMISKWRINLSVIYHFLKNQMLIFQFLNRRNNSKMQIIRWMRQNLFNFKQINLSKMWKSIFMKSQSGMDDSEYVTIVELYSNIFYTLSIEPLISKEILTNILIECLRQALQFRIKIPDQLQILSTELLLETKRYELLTYLCHHDVVKSDPRIYKIIFKKGENIQNQLLITLSIDLASQSGAVKQILRLLLKAQRVKQGKRYLKANYQKMEVLDMLEVAKYLKNGEKKREFVKFVRFFIIQRYPTMNTIYLDQAQQQLFL